MCMFFISVAVFYWNLLHRTYRKVPHYLQCSEIANLSEPRMDKNGIKRIKRIVCKEY